MNSRILPPEEWSRLERKPVMLFPYVQPENVDVVAVEDEGEIVACMTVLRATHFEGLWIDPDKRRKAGVLRALLRQATTLAQVRGERWVFGGAEKDEMRGFLKRLGGVPVPMDLCALWVGREECRLS